MNGSNLYSPIIIIAVIFIGLRCSSSPDTAFPISCSATVDSLELSFSEVLNTPIPEAQYTYWFSSTYSEKGKDYFFGLTPNNTLEIFDVTNGQHLRTLSFNDPNYISMTDFYVHSLDSIYVYSHEDYQMFCVNIQGEILKKYTLNTEKALHLLREFGLAGLESIRCRINYDSFNDLFYFPVASDKPQTDPDFYKSPFILVFDMVKEDYIDVVGQFPETYGKELNTIITRDGYSILPLSNGNFIINFYQSSFIYEYNWREDEFVKAYCLESNLFKGEFLPFDDNFDNVGQMIEYITEVDRFGPLMKYKNGYYVTFKDRQSYRNPDGTTRDVFDSRWSVVLLDSAFQKIGETTFEGGHYLFYTVLPIKDGLLLNKDHVYNNKEDKEDLLEFDFFKIVNKTMD